MSIYPWNQVGTNGSPFVLTFQHMGITVAAGILNFVVITASLSAINSDVFGVGRMLHGMAEQGHAPKMFSKVSKRGIPWVTVVVMMLALLLAVYLNYIMPESVFLVIASLATFATVWVWIMILFSQIAFRRSLSKEQVKQLAFPLRGGVFTSVVAIVFLVFIIGLIGYFPTTRVSLYAGLVWVVLLLAGYWFKVNHQKNARRWRRSKTKWKTPAEPVFLAFVFHFILPGGARFDTHVAAVKAFFLFLAGAARQHFANVLHIAAEGAQRRLQIAWHAAFVQRSAVQAADKQQGGHQGKQPMT